MLIPLRDNNGNLHAKDILRIDFDMKVAEKNNNYVVCVNDKYHIDDVFNDKEDAEEEMLRLVACRNQIEQELRDT